MKLSGTLEDITTVGVLRAAITLPTLILLVLLMVISILNLIFRDVAQSVFFALVISGGVSEIPLFLKLKVFDKKYIVKDNEGETGCRVYMKKMMI